MTLLDEVKVTRVEHDGKPALDVFGRLMDRTKGVFCSDVFLVMPSDQGLTSEECAERVTGLLMMNFEHKGFELSEKAKSYLGPQVLSAISET